MKKLLCILLILLTVFTSACGIVSDEEIKDIAVDIATDIIEDAFTESEEFSTEPSSENDVDTHPIAEGEFYYDAESVVLYLHTFGVLPDNYITKDEARDLGWDGGSVEEYLPGAAIGGDYFGNREELLPDGEYSECDIDTNGQNSRGAKRLVFSSDGRYYYTEDHYESFVELIIVDNEVVYK